MPHAIILERDTRVVDWKARLSGWASTASDTFDDEYSVRSDGLTYPDFATLDVAAFRQIAANDCHCVGIHIDAPQPSEEYTPYQITVAAMAEDLNVRPFLFIGESPAVITADATGDIVTDIRIIATADTSALQGGTMDKELTIVVGLNTADRKLCVGVGMMSGATLGASKVCYASLCVRRLVGVVPTIFNTRKQ